MTGLVLVGCTTTGDVLDAIGTGTGDLGATASTGASGSGASAGDSSSTGTPGDPCGSDGAWWCPEPGSSWQVQRYVPIDDTVAAAVISVPLFTTDLAAMAALHAQDRRVLCWFSAGISTWGEPDRDVVSPAATGPEIVPGQPERWMDLDSPIVRDAMIVRLDQARALGCDGVEPSDIDGYLADSGLALTRAGTVDFVTWLVDEAHAHGLAIALHDGNELVAELGGAVDLALDYGCLASGTCASLAPISDAGKLVLHAEIVAPEKVGDIATLAIEVCSTSAMLSIVTVFKKPDLGGWAYPCD